MTTAKCLLGDNDNEDHHHAVRRQEKQNRTNANASFSTLQIIRLFIGISIYRLANAWMIRTQFDPDEYWQTLEPAYCLVFGSSSAVNSTKTETCENNRERIHGCALTWEWTRRWTPSSSSTEINESGASASSKSIILQKAEMMIEQALHGPVRSYVSILPTYWYYLSCRSLFRWADITGLYGGNDNNAKGNHFHNYQLGLKRFIRRHATYIISKGPAFVNAILVAAPTDLSVWLIASRMNSVEPTSFAINKCENRTSYWTSWAFWALLCSITSWFQGYALVRTYANSVETMCLLVGIALLGPELVGQSELELGRKPGRGHRPLAKLAFVLGGLSACVRFTSLAAWIPVGIIISFRSGSLNGGKNSYNYGMMLHTLVGLCATYGLIGVILGCCIDRWFYGFWAIPFLGNIHFNVLLGHGSLYGTHPFLWYVYAGVPAICGIMLPFFLLELAMVKNVASNVSPKDQSESKCNNPQVTLLWIIAPYVVLHSFSEHKEFRFLLPVLPLICILAGRAMVRLAFVLENATNPGSIGGRSYKSSLKLMFVDKTRSTSPKLLLLVLILLNYPHLLYLGLVHQRGPMAVSQFLASTIDENAGRHQSEYSIDYLMGCHSAPLYSHLHIPDTRIDALYLDCSPNCRSSRSIVCESDAFASDPLGFTQSIYGGSSDDDCSEECMIKELPSFLVLMQDDDLVIRSVLKDKLNMSHVSSIRHTVKSLSWHRQSHHDASSYEKCVTHERCHDVITLFSLIDIHFDHMEVYMS